MSYRKNAKALDEHVVAIGWLCVDWAHIEVLLDQFIGSTALTDWSIRSCVTANATMSEKIKMVLALGFHRKPSDSIFEQLQAVLNKIENELRPERNKHVHGFWIIGENETIRVHEKTKIMKAQSHHPLELRTHERQAFTADEIWDLVRRVNEASADLTKCLIHYSVHMDALRASWRR